ncbi:MAG TPA: ABC transporter substrate-binding protein [Candidatus Lustribacter sp.]|jgi:NitT/TauT family transport system substrate-binding protein|nr:ABC transporter substrate-binding protein [Candidatus Lustribacter sp.]
MNVNRKGALRAFGALAVAVATPAAAAPPVHIIVGPGTSPDMAAFYRGIEQGTFKNAGLDLDVQAVANGGSGIAAAIGGSINISYANFFTLTQAFSRGVPIRLVAPGTIYRATTPTARLLVAADSDVRGAQDLVGKVVGLNQLHDLLALAMFAWLDRNGVDRTKVQFVEVPPRSMMPGLASKRLDAAFIFEPYTGSMMAQGAKVIGTPFDAIAPRWMPTAWFTVADWSKDHRAAALRFAEVLTGIYPYANTHYAELIPLISSFSKLSPETLRTMTPVLATPSFDSALMQPVIDAAVKYGEIAKTFDARTMLL